MGFMEVKLRCVTPFEHSSMIGSLAYSLNKFIPCLKQNPSMQLAHFLPPAPAQYEFSLPSLVDIVQIVHSDSC